MLRPILHLFPFIQFSHQSVSSFSLSLSSIQFCIHTHSLSLSISFLSLSLTHLQVSHIHTRLNHSKIYRNRPTWTTRTVIKLKRCQSTTDRKYLHHSRDNQSHTSLLQRPTQQQNKSHIVIYVIFTTDISLLSQVLLMLLSGCAYYSSQLWVIHKENQCYLAFQRTKLLHKVRTDRSL